MALDDNKRIPITAELAGLLWNAAFERKEGWRMGDGGKSFALPNDRSLWVFGDSWATGTDPTDPNNLRFIQGSVAAISNSALGQGALGFAVPSVRFYARTPSAGVVLDISTAAGVDQLATDSGLGVKNTGGFEVTGQESSTSFPKTILWFTSAIGHGSTLFLFYQGVTINADGSFPGDGTQYVYTVTNADQDISLWNFQAPRVLLPKTNPNLNWDCLYDDTAESPYVYAFGLDSATYILYAARIPINNWHNLPLLPDWSSLPNYSEWEFLTNPPAKLLQSPELWVKGDDSNLRPIATNVGIEYSVDHLIVNGVSRWLLVHSNWAGYGWATGQGFLRVSNDDTILTFPDEVLTSPPTDDKFYWIDVHDLDPQFNSADPKYAGFFRGFSLHAELSGLSRNGNVQRISGWNASGTEFPVILGYTLFQTIPLDQPQVWTDINCANDYPGQCGSRRFGVVDLAAFWPKAVPVVQWVPPQTIQMPWISVSSQEVGQVQQGATSVSSTPASRPAAVETSLPNLHPLLSSEGVAQLRQLSTLTLTQLRGLAEYALSFATPEERAALRGITSTDWNKLIAAIRMFRNT